MMGAGRAEKITIASSKEIGIRLVKLYQPAVRVVAGTVELCTAVDRITPHNCKTGNKVFFLTFKLSATLCFFDNSQFDVQKFFMLADLTLTKLTLTDFTFADSMFANCFAFLVIYCRISTCSVSEKF
jgi:hypothetical protein